MRRIGLIAVLILMAAAITSTAQAQVAEKPISWQIYGGWAPVGGTATDYLKDGWDLGFGVTWRPNPAKAWGLKFDTDYTWWDGKDILTQSIAIDHARARSWALTADFVYESKGRGKVGWYAGAGVGGYGLYGQQTQDAIVAGWYCDFWGYCWYVPVAGEAIVRDKHTIKFGYNAQLGIRFKLANASEIALETKYNWVQTSKTFEYYPINIAFRF